MASKRIKIAIDGCGALTIQSILPHLYQPDFQERGEVVAVCDIVQERVERIAREYNIRQVYTEYDQMLSSAEADAVLVIVPASLHASHAIQAAQAGLHIYLQKPLATSVDDAKKVIEAVRQSGVKMVCAPAMQLWPLYQQIRDLIEQGAIGKPYLAQAPMLGWGGEAVEFPTNPAWFFGPNGGPLRDHGGYSLGALTTILGPVQRVTAFSGTAWAQRTWNGQPFAVTGDDNTAVLLDFGGNLFGLLPEAWCESSPATSVLRIHGLNGSIEGDWESANGIHVFPFGCTVYPSGKQPYRLEVNPAEVPALAGRHFEIENAHVYADILHLVDCIQRDTQPIVSPSAALHTVEVIEAAYRAAATGQVQEIKSGFTRR